MPIKEHNVGYDIIGDIHGCASALEDLLLKLGYQEIDGVYQPGQSSQTASYNRQVIFLGDLLDRGPDIPRTVEVVKKMCDAGTAQMVLGNHELNAIAYHTPYNDSYLRPHNERNRKQINETLVQFSGQEALFNSYLDWFETLPLFLEFDSFRVVHACWDDELINRYYEKYQTNRFVKSILYENDFFNSIGFRAIDRLTKGISLPFPDDMPVKGRDGYYRHNFRVHFWSIAPEVYNDIVFQPDPLPDMHRYKKITDVERRKLVYYPPAEKPLFVGHYWLSGSPELVANNIACLDYSAVNNGKLVAYRFNTGDSALDTSRFVYVESDWDVAWS